MRQLISFIPLLLVLLLAAPAAHAQDVSAYTLHSGEEDVFQREVDAALALSPLAERLPRLGCTVEYIRRLDGEDIVYRRGPIDMHLHGALPAATYPVVERDRGTRPISPDDAAQSHFTGGILVDLPRPGESSEEQAVLPSGYRYMLRVALVPQSYENTTLTARIFLERAVVHEEGDELTVYRSEVFSRVVELDGNLPLKFDLPVWDSALPGGEPAVPARLREGVLVTLETPHQFGLPGSYPQPFRERTRISYAVPTTSQIRLTIRVEDEEYVLDEGLKKPGTYDIVWDAEDLPDNSYIASMIATDADGATMFEDEHTLTKQHDATSWQPAAVAVMHTDAPGRFVLSTESGIGFQFPKDNARSMRNMFTHVVLRLGYRVSSSMELGLLVGQEAFHETPAENIDVDRISDYGGVVGMTYGFAGAYARWNGTAGAFQPFVQASAALSDSAPLLEAAAGVRTTLLRHIDVYVAPAAVMHLRTETSYKLGIHYGLQVRF